MTAVTQDKDRVCCSQPTVKHPLDTSGHHMQGETSQDQDGIRTLILADLIEDTSSSHPVAFAERGDKEASLDFGNNHFDFVASPSSQGDHVRTEPFHIACEWEHTKDHIDALFTPWTEGPCMDLQTIDVHPMSRIALERCKEVDYIDVLDIFTDGSFCPQKAASPARGAWAFTIFCRGHTHAGEKASQWLGYYSGKVVEHTHQNNERCGVGVIEASPFEAERSALWWAAAYLLQSPLDCPACIHFDSTAAGDTASGNSTGGDWDSDFGIGATIRSVFQTVGHSREITFRHVKGHTGQAGNELADSIAFAQCSDAIPDGTPMISIPFIPRTSKSFMQWLFADQGGWDRPQLGHQHILFQGFRPAKELPFEWRPGDLHRPTTQHTVGVNMKILSYNVMTTRRYGSIGLLRQQLQEQAIHVAGFQETRDGASRVWPGQPYFRFCSAATDQGIGGLQLWISSQLPFAVREGRPIRFERKNFTVTLATPRLLIVHGHAAHIHFAFVVGHAPHSGDDSATDWWSRFSDEVAKIPERAHKIFMIDANSRMNRFDDHVCGPHGSVHSDTHEDCSDMFHRALIEHQMWLPATHASCHTGDHITWSIGDRPGAHLDYIAVPEAWQPGELASCVNADFLSGISLYDHKAVQLNCIVDLEGGTDAHHHRIPLDRVAMMTPEGKDRCRQIFEAMPRLPATTDPTIHCHVVEQFLQQELTLHFKLNRRKCKKQHISAASYENVLAHRHSRRSLRDCYRWKDHTILLFCFQRWAEARYLGTAAPVITLQEFINLVEDSPHRARGLLRKAQQAALNMRIRDHHAKSWHQRFSQQLADVGFTFAPAAIVIDDDDGSEQEGFLCPCCAKFFQTPHQVATHMMRQHGIHAQHYKWSNRTSCLCCMQEFFTTKRLAAHFQHGGRRCLQMLQQHYGDPSWLKDDRRLADHDHVPFTMVAGPPEEWCEQMDRVFP
eukprot:Skav207030  [mRNA]  locus=scaffold1828:25308:30267:+ [translate_table: standard]